MRANGRCRSMAPHGGSSPEGGSLPKCGSSPNGGLPLLVAVCGLLILAGCAVRTAQTIESPAPNQERVQAHLDLARGYLASGAAGRARAPVQRALQVDPRAVEAHVLAGVLYQREAQAALAERHYKRALALAPRNAQALNNYGAFLYAQGRLQEALRPLRRAVQDRHYRMRAQAFENLGLAELGLGRVEAARLSFERALGLSESRPRSSLQLARILFAQRHYDVAERRYRQFLEQAGETTHGLCLGVALAAVKGASEQSRQHAALLRRRYPRAIQKCR